MPVEPEPSGPAAAGLPSGHFSGQRGGEVGAVSWMFVAMGTIVAAAVWGLLLLISPSPIMATAAIAAGATAILILLQPTVGIYLLVFLMIGQWPYNMISYLGLLTVASYAWKRLLQQQPLIPHSRLFWIVAVYVLFVLLSAAFAKTDIDLRSQVLAQVGNLAFVWLFSTFIDSRQRLMSILQTVMAAGIVTSLIGLIQWRTHFLWIVSTTRYALATHSDLFRQSTGFDLQQWGGQFRVDSITGTPDYLPLYLQCLIPMVALAIPLYREILPRCLGLGLLGLFGVCHLLSYTRGALLTTLVVLFCIGWTLDRRRLMFYSPFVLALGMLVILSWGPWRDRFATMFALSAPESGQKENTGMWRLRTIPVGIEMFLDRPLFGFGIGQQQWNWPESTYGTLIPDPEILEPLPIHNDYLRVAIELGVGGISMILLMLLTSMLQMHWAAVGWAAEGDRWMAAMANAVKIATLGIAAAMCMYPITGNFRYYWLLIGLSSAITGLYEQSMRGQSAT